MLYFTGSGHFNRSMRLGCKKANLSLSDRGLTTRDGSLEFSCATERDIFNALDRYFKQHSRVAGGCEYVAPKDREARGKMGRGPSGNSIHATKGDTAREWCEEAGRAECSAEERDTCD